MFNDLSWGWSRVSFVIQEDWSPHLIFFNLHKKKKEINVIWLLKSTIGINTLQFFFHNMVAYIFKFVFTKKIYE